MQTNFLKHKVQDIDVWVKDLLFVSETIYSFIVTLEHTVCEI